MIQILSTTDLTKLYPNYQVKRHDSDSFLLVPTRKLFPRETYLVDRTAYLDEHENLLNGVTPIFDLLSKDYAEMGAKLLADLDFPLQGELQNVQFLRAVPLSNTTTAYHIVRPSQATHFSLITRWDRSKPGPHNGASRNYASAHGAERFYNHRPKSKQRGQDFWLLPIAKLSAPIINQFDTVWYDNIDFAIRKHSRRNPKDGLAGVCRDRLDNPT